MSWRLPTFPFIRVSSALRRLTALFGMEKGVSTALNHQLAKFNTCHVVKLIFLLLWLNFQFFNVTSRNDLAFLKVSHTFKIHRVKSPEQKIQNTNTV